MSVEVWDWNHRLYVRAPDTLKDKIQHLGGAYYAPKKKLHNLPLSIFTAKKLHRVLVGAGIREYKQSGGFTALLAAARNLTYLQSIKTDENLPQPLIRATDGWYWQRQAYALMQELPAVMLAMGVGTGKSKSIIDLIQNSDHLNILIVMPNHALHDENTWEKQFNLHCAIDYVYVPLRDGKTKLNVEKAEFWMRRLQRSKMPLILGINYESVWRHDFAEFLVDSEFADLLVFDESHKIKGASSSVSRFASRLAQRFTQKVCLTGTVFPNSPLDAFGQYRALDPNILGTSFTEFRDRYADVFMKGDIPIINGFQNEEELAERIAPITHEVPSSVLGLPEPIQDIRTFDLSTKERKAYDDLEQTFAFEAEAGYITINSGLTKPMRLSQLTGGYLPLTEFESDQTNVTQIGHSKQDLLIDLLEELAGERVVIFYRFVADAWSIRDAARKLKYPYGEISGQARDKKLWDAGLIQVLGVNEKSAEAIDLTASNYAIVYSSGHSLGVYEQCIGRLQRPGQEKFVYIIHLVATNSVDEDIVQGRIRKENIRAKIVKRLRMIAREGRK